MECRMDKAGAFSIARRRLDDDLTYSEYAWLDPAMAFVGENTLSVVGGKYLRGEFDGICAPTFEELRIKLAAQGIL